MTADLGEIVADFATAFKVVDAAAPQGQSKTRLYKPGIGPLTEDVSVRLALNYLVQMKSALYQSAVTSAVYPGGRKKCDLIIPSEWAIEFKLIRPFGDNGLEAEHWSENILHPYPGTTSAVGDCLKLRDSTIGGRKGIIVFGYEHTPPIIDLTVAVRAFEVIAQHVVDLHLSERYYAEFTQLIHPHHQQGKVFGWEIL